MGGVVENVLLGSHIAFSAGNLLYCFLGVFLGTLIGVLPGIGPAGAISMLLPITFGMDPVSSIIMLAGIYYGAQYGGSTTSILVNIPGEASSVVTCLDGYQMARQGRAGPALGIAAFGSFIAGTVGVIALMIVAEPLSSIAIWFGPPEYFALMILALTILTYLAQGSMIKAIIMGILGVVLSQIGLDFITAYPRFTFGIPELGDGLGLIPVVMGLFGVSEVLSNLETSGDLKIFAVTVRGLLPSVQDWRESWKPILRGSIIGFFLGVLPGGGALVSSFASYAVEKRLSKHPETFGTGAIEGVAGPESANNAASSGAFIPLFALGIPANAIMALLLGGLMIHGVQPGPLMIKEHPDIFWGTIVSMYVGNVMLLVLNLPLIGMWVKLLKVPYRRLFPLILVCCVIGSYSVNNSTFDVVVMVLFGILGCIFRRYGYEPAPLVMAFILGPVLENSLRKSLLISQGDFSIFFTRTIAVAFLTISLLLILSNLFLRKPRQIIAQLG